MSDTPFTVSAIEALLEATDYDELVEAHILRLARELLEDEEVNQTLLDQRAQVGRALEGQLNTEGSTLSEMLSNAAPSGLTFSPIGSRGEITVPVKQTESFLRGLLTLAGHEVARLEFSGPKPQPTTRELMTRELEVMRRAGDPNAQRLELVLKHDDPEVLDSAVGGIFGPPPPRQDATLYEPLRSEDDRRVDARSRAEAARVALLAALGEGTVFNADLNREIQTLDSKIQEVIAKRFDAPSSNSNELTVAIGDAVQTALALVGETRQVVVGTYTNKIMGLANLAKLRGGDQTTGERLRKARTRKRKSDTQSG
jgi:hypothetical protein